MSISDVEGRITDLDPVVENGDDLKVFSPLDLSREELPLRSVLDVGKLVELVDAFIEGIIELVILRVGGRSGELIDRTF